MRYDPSTNPPRAGAFEAAPDILSAMHSGGVAAWRWRAGAMTATLDPLAMAWWGVGASEVAVEDLLARVDPADREETGRIWREAAEEGRPFVHAFRVDGRWIAARGDEPAEGEPFTAVFLDVTDMRRAREMQDLMLREMGHRIGNLFAVASATATIAAKGAHDAETLVADLRQRFAQLSGAFRMVARGEAGAALGPMLAVLLRPYADAGRLRVEVEGPALHQDEVTTLSLALHELATNAMKYGALSAPGGHVELTGGARGGRLELRWRERGGPVPEGVPEDQGLGRHLVDTAIAGRPGGRTRWRAPPGGIEVDLGFELCRGGG
ncbi:two-component sensor histidine kinase [Hasllibacter halocynthiae]|uniref:histidine kinase n=1 Tax=Hasllibacter halocynthiae TaxID=595589 RepID=A0A2T0X1J7_9RHOB|nr:HWE histidine kinase domain-containing protein [Hasllibacter halocynthiae]PRY92734.1 two-component sensor histidine kinase [Hasllibacter halocynthiae]